MNDQSRTGLTCFFGACAGACAGLQPLKPEPLPDAEAAHRVMQWKC